MRGVKSKMKCFKCNAEIPDASVYCNICGVKQEKKTAKNPKRRGNGQGSVYKRGNKWEAAVVCYAGGNRTRKRKCGFERKKDALAYIETLKHSAPSSSTIAYLWEIYSNNALLKLGKSKQTAYNIAYRRLSDIRGKKISDLTISDLQTCVNNNATSYYTAHDMKVVLSHLYKMALAQTEVTVNLSQFIVLPELDETEPIPFNEIELSALWSRYESDPHVGYILLMIYTGMMPGELLECKKDMIDFDNRTIIGCGLKTKTRKKIPLMICDIIEPVLKQLITLSPTDYLWEKKKHAFYDWFYKVLSETGCRALTPYACRHTTATALALGNKVAPSVIKRVMRHANIQTTQRYIHPDTRSMLDALNTLPN